MPNTFSQLIYHIVFSVKDKKPLLNNKIQNELYKYFAGIANNHNFKIISAGGTSNHVHILLSLKPDLKLSKCLQLIKGGSSKWIHDNFSEMESFSWQAGYGAFTVSKSQENIIKNYIAKQKEHHEKISFEDEYRKLLILNNIKFEEKYLF